LAASGSGHGVEIRVSYLQGLVDGQQVTGQWILMGSQQLGLLQLRNLSALAVDCGISTNRAKGLPSVLEASYIVFTLKPHHANFGKQFTKSPRLYFHDTGLAVWLAGLRSADALSLSSMRGALFEIGRFVRH
jgi:hypothetical protein